MNRREFLAGAGLIGFALNWRDVLDGRMGYVSAEEIPGRMPQLSLWYNQPASQWNEALPLGNGHMGAMVYGDVAQERIQLNESTLWTGGPHNYVNREAFQYLDRMRDLIFNEKVVEADALSAKLLGNPSQQQAFQPFCDLEFEFDMSPMPLDYRRALNLETAIAEITYSVEEVQFRRQSFLSYPDKVFGLHLSASQPGQHSLTLSLSSLHPSVSVHASEDGTLLLTGQMQADSPPAGSWIAPWNAPGLRFAAGAKVILSGGHASVQGDKIAISAANSVTVLVHCATSFESYNNIEGDPVQKVEDAIHAAQRYSLDDLLDRHQQDHQRLFQRVSLRLGADEEAQRSTSDRIQKFSDEADPSFIALLYQFGRYMLIASSRPGGQPANLQGIWNSRLWPWWGSKWTTNINLEMNYWPAETGNLAECVEPLYDLIDGLRITGAEVAKVQYGCKGFVFHHNADLWRAAAPADGSWGLWPVGGVWLVQQMWEHYEFSLDEDFLRRRAYPALKEAAEFMLDFLVEIPQGEPFAGCLATNPTSSPENAFILPDGTKGRLTYATAMDIELLDALFDHCMRAAEILSIDSEFRTRLAQTRKRLPPLQVGARGQLQEWIKDYTETEIQHRHLSHLYALYPGNGISLEGTPALAAAARKSLELRGDANGPGSCFKAWRMACWARLRDGNHANRILTTLITQSTSADMLNDSYDQVDGHFGAPAAIAEMLIQSQRGEIVLLPALPNSWTTGALRGFCARGGATVDLAWKAGQLTHVTIHTQFPGRLKLRYGSVRREIAAKGGMEYRLDQNLQ
jgi:alpha-L-fucosidase 2